jgi:glutamate-1-semialdehyde 2,1-aminomutase
MASDLIDNEDIQREIARFNDRTRRSREAFERVDPLIPGGAPGGGIAYTAIGSEIFMERGDGCWIWDVDGNRYLDLIAGDWVLLFGHRDPGVESAVRAQLEKSILLFAPEAELGYAVAAEINRRIPSMERMRFTTSGTEAVMHAMRIARVASGRPKIAKMRGAYHGTYDPSLIANGKYTDVKYVPPGLAPGTVETTVLLEFNDVERSLEVIRAEKDELAGIIVEPIHATNGMVPATSEFLQALRDETARHGIVLIFDETVTWSVAENAGQGMLGVTPDLTTMGKVIGGGLPLGVFGGSSELMRWVDSKFYPRPLGELRVAPIRHGSTLAGRNMTLATAHATLQSLTPEAHARLGYLGDYMRSGVRGLAADLGMPLQITGAGHLFGLHWTEREVVDMTSAMTSNRRMIHLWNLFLSNRGFFMFPNAGALVTTPMSEGEIDSFVDALREIVVSGDKAGWLEY